MTRMIDPKDLEAVIETHMSRLLYFDLGDALDDLVALVPATPKHGEAWLVSTREGEQREALKAGNRWYVKDGDYVEAWVEEALTPIARLVPEVDPTPDILSTEVDYRRVPAQTVVKSVSEAVTPAYEKLWSGKWRVTGSSHTYTSEDMALVARTVIYSPEEKKTAN